MKWCEIIFVSFHCRVSPISRIYAADFSDVEIALI